jgi:hypothetical protein
MNRVKIVTIYKNLFSNKDFFLENFFKSMVNRKEPELESEQEPEPKFIISAPAPGGNIISAHWLLALGSCSTTLFV